jgi:SpoVK/Ycf46/Vps4 family AAA+-type ATPase
MIFMAAKSNAALRDFLRALREYRRMRRKKSRLMIGINGHDLLAPPVAWDEVILPPGQAEAIRGNVEAFFQDRERYRQLGIPYRRGLLFVGPPGCGKTLTIKAIAHSIRATFITVLGKADIEDGDIERAFELGVEHSPAVLLFEDVEKLMKSERVHFRIFSTCLTVCPSLKA